MFDEYRNAVAVKEISGDVTPSHPILSWVFYAFFISYSFPFYPICTYLVRQRKLAFLKYGAS